MLERLSFSNSTVSRSVFPQSNKSSKNFSKYFDKAFSQQNELRDQIRQSDHSSNSKKNIKELQKTINEFVEKYSDKNTGSAYDFSLLENISGLIEEFFNNFEEELSIEGSELSEFVNSFQNMLSFIQQNNLTQAFSLEEFQNLINQMSFVLEGTPPQKHMINTNYYDVLSNLTDQMNNLLNEEIAPLLGDNSELSDAKLDLSSSEWKAVDAGTEIFEFSPQTSDSDQSVELSNDNKLELKNFTIKDLRSDVSKSEVSKLEDPPLTLEQIDAENLSETPQDTKSFVAEVQLFGGVSDKYNTAAQKLYTSLSSAVTRVQVDALMQSVSGKAAIILQDGGSELQMKLTPPELGKMKLSFVMEDSIMLGKVVVETPEAKLFFEQNIDNLRESLAQAGIRLSNVDVELGGRNDFAEQDEPLEPIYAVRKSSDLSGAPIERKKILSDSLVDFTA
ncbi:MAG: flagellar hook-length control protein FliK [Brevinemataceae bacterium]